MGVKEFLKYKVKRFISSLYPGRKYVLRYTDKGKILWYVVGKAASRTVLFHLRSNYADIRTFGTYPVVPWLWKGYKKIVVVRDDNERWESAHREKVLMNKIWTEEEYNEHMSNRYEEDADIHVKPCHMCYDPKQVDIFTDVDHLDELFKELGLYVGKIERINATKSPNNSHSN